MSRIRTEYLQATGPVPGDLAHRCPQHQIGSPDAQFYYLCDDCRLSHALEPGDVDRYGNRYHLEAEYEESQRRVAEKGRKCEPQQSDDVPF